MIKNYSLRLLKMNRKDIKNRLKRNFKIYDIVLEKHIGDDDYWKKLIKEEQTMLDDLNKSIKILEETK